MMLDRKIIADHEDLNDSYYHFINDILKYPDAWCYVVYSRRGPGKTYSALWESYYLKIPCIYMKRTNDDVEFICKEIAQDLESNPYVPINRDKGTNITSKLIDTGVGGFYERVLNEEGKYVVDGAPFNLILSLNRIKAIKGFEASKFDWILLDEFIPQAGEIVKKKEGEMLLDLYMTVSRDRVKRGKAPVKLILFANAEEISTPITNTLEIVDDMAELNHTGETYKYLEERGILIHHITSEEYPLTQKEQVGIYKGMQGTAWASKAFEGEFANNDFSCIEKVRMKHYKPLCSVKYKNKYIYIYQRDDRYYVTSSRHLGEVIYNLDRESEQLSFALEVLPELRMAFAEDHIRFEKYSMYDLIINYKKFFKV